MVPKFVGLNDVPVDPAEEGADKLAAGSYYEGLADYIARCVTPMTIAVQGDWGSGKTTTLNFVKKHLKDHNSSKNAVSIIEFNTWLYSQFDLGESLVFSLAHEIVQPMLPENPAAKKFLSYVSKAGAAALQAGAKAAASSIGAQAIVESLFNLSHTGDPNLVGEIKSMRHEFKQTVLAHCEKNKVDRVVIMIDDLDRVDPIRAIEILESLKLLFEVDRCVFVLALDFDVVMRGVKEKYGNSAHHLVDDRKARQYFDKIIQLPFAMPMDAYVIDDLIQQPLEATARVVDPTVMEKYKTLTSLSVGTNPRSIKRLLNSFELLSLILAARKRTGDNAALLSSNQQRAQLVFGLLCIEQAFPGFHRQLLEKANEVDDESGSRKALSIMFVEHDIDDTEAEEKLKKSLSEAYNLTSVEISNFRLFRRAFWDIARPNKSDSDPDAQIIEALELTRVTSSAIAQPEPAVADTPTTEVEGRIAKRTSEATAKLVTTIHSRLQEIRGPRKIGMLAQANTNTVTLYTDDDLKKIQSVGPRSRPRFASITYQKKGINVTFGTAGEDGSYKEAWTEAVKTFRELLPEDNPGIRFSVREGYSYPLYLDRILSANPTEQQIDIVAQVLLVSYDVVKEKKPDLEAIRRLVKDPLATETHSTPS